MPPPQGVTGSTSESPTWRSPTLAKSWVLSVIIGYSPERIEDARASVKAGADYLGIGPVYGTPSKADAGEPIGLEGLSVYIREVSLPVVAVGGITAENAAQVLTAGAVGVAVMSAVTSAPDVARGGWEDPRKNQLDIWRD